MSKQLVLLSPSHAAGRTKLSVSRLRQLEALGEIRAIRDSAGRRLYDSAQVDAFIRRRAEQRRERQQPSRAQVQPPAPGRVGSRRNSEEPPGSLHAAGGRTE